MAESGSHVNKYGGNTSCFSMETDSGMILIDAGTGLRHVGRELGRVKAVGLDRRLQGVEVLQGRLVQRVLVEWEVFGHHVLP